MVRHSPKKLPRRATNSRAPFPPSTTFRPTTSTFAPKRLEVVHKQSYSKRHASFAPAPKFLFRSSPSRSRKTLNRNVGHCLPHCILCLISPHLLLCLLQIHLPRSMPLYQHNSLHNHCRLRPCLRPRLHLLDFYTSSYYQHNPYLTTTSTISYNDDQYTVQTHKARI